ncbi:MAG: hypothetical protein JWP35_263 [Caulobacter sp.]|nr:hypothetical protein [Caulobacter sp.]
MIKFALAAGAAVSLLLGVSAFAQDAAPAAAAPEAATPAAAPAAAPSDAASTKGHIYFFRPWRLSGGVYTYHIVEVGDDGKPAKGTPHLGDLPNAGAFEVDVEPGIHSYNITGPMAINKDEDRLRIDVEPGETYYIEQTVRMGLVTGGFKLVPADKVRFDKSKVKMTVQKGDKK